MQVINFITRIRFVKNTTQHDELKQHMWREKDNLYAHV